MITVTAATGRLGRLVIQELLDCGVPATEIVPAANTDLERLIGRPTPLAEAVAAALKAG